MLSTCKQHVATVLPIYERYVATGRLVFLLSLKLGLGDFSSD